MLSKLFSQRVYNKMTGLDKKTSRLLSSLSWIYFKSFSSYLWSESWISTIQRKTHKLLWKFSSSVLWQWTSVLSPAHSLVVGFLEQTWSWCIATHSCDENGKFSAVHWVKLQHVDIYDIHRRHKFISIQTADHWTAHCSFISVKSRLKFVEMKIKLRV